jgi:tetratricopeptide (TPR) repeat protein
MLLRAVAIGALAQGVAAANTDDAARSTTRHGNEDTPTVAPEQLAKLPAPRPLSASTISPREAQGLVNLGGNLTDRGDFPAAEIAYRQVLNGNAPLEPTKSALLGLARMHRKQGYLTKAAAIYERYLKDYPSDERVPDALLDLGRTLRDMGAPRLAIARFYNVINSTLKLPSDTGFEHYQLLAKTAQFEVAETHFQSGDFAEANKFFSRLRMLDLAPADRARAHFKAGYSLQLSGDLEGAITTLRAYIEQSPEDENVPEARFLVATTLRKLNRAQEALTATLELLRAEHTRSAADAKRWNYWQRRTGNQLANDFFQSGDIVNALSIYSSLASLGEDASWRVPVNYQVALCYERLGDIDRAKVAYQAIVAEAGESPSSEIADIARMAKSRLAHVDWRNHTDRQVSALFDSHTGEALSPAPKSASNDSNRGPATAPATL